jgi:hypothetical protein
MVDPATALAKRQADTWVRVIGKALRGIPEAERYWADPHEPEDERVRDHLAFHAEWDEQVSRFEELAAAYALGRFAPDEDARFRELVGLIDRALPELQRLKLRAPFADLMQRLMACFSPRSA